MWLHAVADQHIEGGHRGGNSVWPRPDRCGAGASRLVGVLPRPLPYYPTAFTQAGFEPADWSEGGSDRLIDSIVAWGSTADIRKRVEEFGNAGADRVVLNVVREDEAQRAPGKPPAIIGDWEGM